MLKNKTQNKIICKKTKMLKSIFSKARGLMFSRKITDIAYVFVFEKPMRIDLHMFFVFFPIDVLFLDKEKKVIEIKENFKPFTFYYSKKKASFVVEVPKGKGKFCKINDVLDF